ncbi:MAG: tRNA pseudouridine(55) synthase TruB [Chloroflexota bacterium]
MLNVCKPSGTSSHHMVSLARRLFHQRRVGHAGTLDPLAEGVLPVLLGRATRLANLVTDDDKLYFAEILLGRVTTTDDLEGEILTESPVPVLTDAEILAVLRELTGIVQQRPPVYSAIKQSGVTSYTRARRGEQFDLPLRAVRIDEIQMIRRSVDRLIVTVRCGKGTYIRALARDIGERLGCGGTVARLIRLRVGRFDLESAVTPDELRHAAEGLTLAEHVLPPDHACLSLPAIVLDEPTAALAVKGQGWPASDDQHDLVRVYGTDGSFIGLARREPDHDDSLTQTWWRIRVMILES